MTMRNITGAIAAAVLAGASAGASAETDQVRFAQQFGLLYLPMHVVVDKKLVEACAKDAGLGDVKVSMHRFSGGAAVNQALLSGNVGLRGRRHRSAAHHLGQDEGRAERPCDVHPLRDAAQAQHQRSEREGARGLPGGSRTTRLRPPR